MSRTNLEEQAILDARFGSGSPATWWVGLSTSTPAEDGTGATEPVGNAYARVAVTNNVTNFPAATVVSGVGTKSNGTAVTFPTPTGSWGTVTHVTLHSAATAGNLHDFQALDVANAIVSGNSVQFPIGSLKFTQD